MLSNEANEAMLGPTWALAGSWGQLGHKMKCEISSSGFATRFITEMVPVLTDQFSTSLQGLRAPHVGENVSGLMQFLIYIYTYTYV